MADEAICIGSVPTQPYLNIDTLLSAVESTGADAVHPGYGFLSESRKFAETLESIGVSFVGPNSNAMRLMGDKIESKRMASRAGLKCIPGYDGEVFDIASALKIAHDIGYPIMVKASAGGGGRGMRVVRNSSELREALILTKQEAKSSFADDRVLLERALPSSRHIEVQVLCDRHGNALHLHVRECSIQRRNQKLLEEAPSTLFASVPSLHQKICDAAVAVAKSVGYDSAGTVEFLLDAEDPQNFYFLEMNTRLQVEHPVSECITGIDVVHQMLRVAKGHRLLYQQTEADIPCQGWAMECRICAEDPYRALGIPSVGQLTIYKEPNDLPRVRCDSGVKEGSHLSVFYDPLISKLVAYGRDRDEVLRTMTKALDSFIVRGITTNIPLLRDLITDPGFVVGNYTTRQLEIIYPDGFLGCRLSQQEFDQMVSLGAAVHLKAVLRNYSNGSHLKNKLFKLCIMVESRSSTLPDKITEITIARSRDGLFNIRLPSSSFRMPDNFHLLDGSLIQTADDGPIFQLRGRNHLGDVCLQFRGEVFWLRIRSEKATAALNTIGIQNFKSAVKKQSRDQCARSGGVTILRAPLPGLITSIHVAPGQTVDDGVEICVLEAMKMRNCLYAPQAGIIKSVHMREGQRVSEGDIILEME
ncbi:hypothetical protein Aperf_G00000049766 [Anoplocephala perfoliata]